MGALLAIWTALHLAGKSTKKKIDPERRGALLRVAHRKGWGAAIKHCLPTILMLPVAAIAVFMYTLENASVLGVLGSTLFILFWGSIHNGTDGVVRYLPAATVSLILLATRLA